MTFITLNVGGRAFLTTRATLCKYPASMLGRMFDPAQGVGLETDAAGVFLIDDDPDVFAVLLNYLRTGRVFLTSNVTREALACRADYYRVPIEEAPKSLAWQMRDAASSQIHEKVQYAVNYFLTHRLQVFLGPRQTVLRDSIGAIFIVSDYSRTVCLYQEYLSHAHIGFLASNWHESLLKWAAKNPEWKFWGEIVRNCTNPNEFLDSCLCFYGGKLVRSGFKTTPRARDMPQTFLNACFDIDKAPDKRLNDSPLARQMFLHEMEKRGFSGRWDHEEYDMNDHFARSGFIYCTFTPGCICSEYKQKKLWHLRLQWDAAH